MVTVFTKDRHYDGELQHDKTVTITNPDDHLSVCLQYTIHEIANVDEITGIIKAHIVLKFFYNKEKYHELFGEKEFPFTIINAVKHRIFSVCKRETQDGIMMKERIEMYVSLKSTIIKAYHPFKWLLVPIKLATNGTKHTEKISWQISPTNNFDFVNRMRGTLEFKEKFERVVYKNNTAQNYGRVYLAFVFEKFWIWNAMKYVVLSTMIAALCIALVHLKQIKPMDIVNRHSTILLVLVALMFNLQTDQFCPSLVALIINVISVVISTFVFSRAPVSSGNFVDFSNNWSYSGVAVHAIASIAVFVSFIYLKHKYASLKQNMRSAWKFGSYLDVDRY